MRNTKKLGIVGGMGTRAGVLFMQKVVDYCPVNRDQEFIEMILHNNSRIPDRTQGILYGKESPEAELVRSIASFSSYQVDIIVLACVTAYHYYDMLTGHTNACILHPVEVLSDHIRSVHSGVKRVGLLASTGTIKTGIFHELSAGNAVDIVTLEDKDQEDEFMASLYMPGGLKSGSIADPARDLFFSAVEKLRQKQVDMIIGGCSEVSILLNQQSLDIPYVDVMDLLAHETVKHCYNLI